MIFEPAGYSFKTENYCPECMFKIAAVAVVEAGIDFRPTKSSKLFVEELLDAWAGELGINRELDIDSNGFPVVITQQIAEHDYGWAKFGGEPVPRCHCGELFIRE